MNGTNPICNMAGYEEKIYKIFSNLKALDGNRKTVEMTYNMIEAQPEEQKIEAEYDTSEVAWFDDTGDIWDVNQALATRFENGTNVKREEKQLTSLINDMKALIEKKNNILTY